ncbi:M20 family metallopeptidase [Bacillus massiliglaciei]|uniref:M20 family metallopeptidase n=1 Tax=Bacillus massiliglaciei TaxID=1816693 RepID=UPI000B182CC9|nr:M20 family metallopeptidase [Bacillus massiliglaciei]
MKWLRQEQEMIQLLKTLVNIDSGSHNKKGVDRVGAILQEEYEKMGLAVEIIQEEIQGNHLVIRHPEEKDAEILIVAHMDTVFPEGTAAERPFQIVGSRAYGPGVADMKASQVQLLYTIKGLAAAKDPALKNIVIILNSDEEIGSPTSRSLIREKAGSKKYALVMEPARPDGSLVTSRRGGGQFHITVEGKAAHSGIEPEKGISAIEELCHKIIDLQKLNDHEHGISVNCGLISGGTAVNTVPAEAEAHIDVRIASLDQCGPLLEQIDKICSTTYIEGTSTVLTGKINRPPMPKSDKTMALLDLIQRAGTKLGIPITDTATGGGSDASFTAAAGAATVDGLGPIGGKAHSEEEYLELDSLMERTELLAELLKELSK